MSEMLLDDSVDGTSRLRIFGRQTTDSLSVLRLAYDGASHGIVVVAEDRSIVFVNALASAILAYSPGELLGQPLSRLLPEPAPAAYHDRWIEFWTHPDRSTMITSCAMAGLRSDGMMVPLDVGLSVVEYGP